MLDIFEMPADKMSKKVSQKKAKLEYQPKASAGTVARKVVKGARLIGLTRGQFSLIDLIYSILCEVGRSRVICCTWSAGIKDANTVRWMVDGGWGFD